MSPRSFKRLTDTRTRHRARFLGDIFAALNTAFQEEATARGLTKAELARRLGINRALVTRRLGGQGNMTFETLHDMAWALGRRVEISLPARKDVGQGGADGDGLLDQAPEQETGISAAGAGEPERKDRQEGADESGIVGSATLLDTLSDRRATQYKAE